MNPNAYHHLPPLLKKRNTISKGIRFLLQIKQFVNEFWAAMPCRFF